MTVLSPPAADDAKVRIALFAPLNDDDDDDLIFGSNAREINDRAENMFFFRVCVCVCL